MPFAQAAMAPGTLPATTLAPRAPASRSAPPAACDDAVSGVSGRPASGAASLSAGPAHSAAGSGATIPAPGRISHWGGPNSRTTWQSVTPASLGTIDPCGRAALMSRRIMSRSTLLARACVKRAGRAGRAALDASISLRRNTSASSELL
jgi:hypothetical protein